MKSTTMQHNERSVLLSYVLIAAIMTEGSAEANLAKFAGLLIFGNREMTGIANPDGGAFFEMKFRCVDVPGLVKALLTNFSQFHLLWVDGPCYKPGSDIPLVGRFGEAWTKEFSPLWFTGEEDGDRYIDGETMLVWNKIGHEFLTGDTLFKVGTAAEDYKYGVPSATPELAAGAIEAALHLAAQPGNYLSTVFPAADYQPTTNGIPIPLLPDVTQTIEDKNRE